MARLSNKFPRVTHTQPALTDSQIQALKIPTELGFALDASGSMCPYQSQIISCFNQVLQDQATLSPAARITVVCFNDEPFTQQHAIPIRSATPLAHHSYNPQDGTALLDGLGSVIAHIESRWLLNRDSRALVVCFTDGYENSSRHYQLFDLTNKIMRLQSEGWAFVFVGPGHQSAAYAGKLGIPTENFVDLNLSVTGLRSIFERLSRAISSFRLGDKTYPLLLQ